VSVYWATARRNGAASYVAATEAWNALGGSCGVAAAQGSHISTPMKPMHKQSAGGAHNVSATE